MATGGAFLTCAVAFSEAKGIFHPYYVSMLAPFGAALVGATAAQVMSGDRAARIVGPLAVAAGVITELIVLHNSPGQLTWLPPLLVGGGIAASVALAAGTGARARLAVLAAVFALLVFAPASWAVQTLGHATSGTFPAGGPASTSSMGGPGGFGGGRGGPQGGGSFRGAPGAAPSAGGVQGGFGGGPQGAPSANGGPPTGAGFGGGPGGGGGSPFGGNSAELTQAEAYVAQHGGGTIAVSSQQGAASAIITKGVNVAGIGGFSGRESQVTVKWLAQEVRSGNIRWVLVDGTGSGGTQDGRTGSSQVMAAVAQTCTKVSYSSSSSSGGTLYDCQGKADALLSAL